jgi:hypothetical protein
MVHLSRLRKSLDEEFTDNTADNRVHLLTIALLIERYVSLPNIHHSSFLKFHLTAKSTGEYLYW